MEEKTLWEGTSSQILNLKFFIFCVIVFIILAIYSIIYSIPLIIIPIIMAFYKWLKIKMIKYEITTERIRVTKGILSKNINELELYRVKDTSFSQPLLLRIFKLGNIIIETSDRSTPKVLIPGILNAHSLREVIRKNIEIRRDHKGVREIDMR